VISTSHVEDILADLKTFLSANLNTYLDAIETAKADGIVLAMPPADRIVIGAVNLDHYKKFPVLFLIPTGEEYEPVTPQRDSIKATIAVWIVTGGFDDVTLNKMVWRYAAELRNVIRDAPTWGGLVDQSMVTEIAYFPIVMGEDELQAARVTVVAEVEAA